MATLTWDKTIAAPRDTVFEVLTDHAGYAAITKVRRVEIERPGDPPPNGVGAIRKLIAVGPPIREEVVEYVPGEKLVYRMLSGAPVRDHVGTVTLSDAGQNQTHMHYVVDTTPTIPVVGGAAVQLVKFVVTDLINGIVGESERRAASAR